MNNREQFHSFSSMSPHDRIEDMKRRFHENRHDPRMFDLPSYVGLPQDRMSPFFERSFVNRQTPPPSNERTVPINVQHQPQSNANISPSNSSSNTQSNTSQTDPQQNFYKPNNEFWLDPESFKFRRPDFYREMNRDPSADEKVHHIPIHVETRSNNHQNRQQNVPQAASPQPQQTRMYTSHEQSPDMAQQQSVPLRHETSPQPNSQNNSQTFTRQASPNASQCEIPIQVIREESLKQNKACPTVIDNEEAKKIEENIPIPMPYAPLNPTKETESAKNTSEGEMNALKKDTPRESINQILDDTREYENQVNEFNGASDDKTYKFLDEMLTRCILKLDDISIEGNEELRKYRKSAVNEINRVVALLESKVKAPKQDNSDERINEKNVESTSQCDTTQESETTETENKDSENNSDKPAEKKEKKKRKFFFKKSSKKEPSPPVQIDTNNNETLSGKETSV